MDEEIMNVDTSSEENQEVADPETVDESVENQEAADPENESQSEEVEEVDDDLNDDEEGSQSPSDAAFASMRRELQEARRQNEQMQKALSIYFNGDDADSLAIQARAYAEERSPEEVQAEVEHEQRMKQLEQENAELQEKLQDVEVRNLINNAVTTLGKIDKNIKSEKDLEKLGDTFLSLIGAGMDTTTAYWAAVAERDHNKVDAPGDIGKASPSTTERDYYTDEELDNLTPEETKKNWDKVVKSMARLS